MSESRTFICLPLEMWLPVPGYEGLYEASTFGRVRSLPHRTSTGLRGGKNLSARAREGYAEVVLYRDGIRHRWGVHVLILTVFRGPRPAGEVACHGPRGKHDNRLTNLSWGTYSKNSGEDRYRDGTALLGELNHKSALTAGQVRQILSRYANGENCRAIAPDYGVTSASVERIIRGETWRHLDGPPVQVRPKTGENCSSAKLTEQAVKEIRQRYATGEGYKRLGRAFGVNETTIRQIIKRRNWKHVA